MKISIITVTFNSERFLRDCILSVANQSYQDIEYIIIDGESTDDTLEIIKSHSSYISSYISEKDGGLYEAMNKGLRMATGDVIGILNSDDFYADNDVLTDVVSVLRDKDVDGVYGNLTYIHPFKLDKTIRFWKAGKLKSKSFLYGWMPPHPTLFLKKKVYEQYGYFNTKFRTSADYELIVRFLHKNSVNVEYIPRVLVKMRAGGLSNSSLKHRIFANKEDSMAWKVNGLKPSFFTFLLKPLRKICQYL